MPDDKHIFNDILIWKNSALPKPDKIRLRGAERGSVSLKDITDYLAAQGVTRLIIVDLTCAPFAVDDTYYSGKITRRFRNDILRKGIPYGGRKTNKTSRKGKKGKKGYHKSIRSRKNNNFTRKKYSTKIKKY